MGLCLSTEAVMIEQQRRRNMAARQRYYCRYGRCDPYYPCRCGGGNVAAYEMERQRQNMITRQEMMVLGNDMIMEDMALANGDIGMAQDIAMMGDMQMMQLEMERMW